jgi:2,4-dienoyl-CoA reductase-like NADH-dependent reductase (Old Yellow Enzyme family)
MGNPQKFDNLFKPLNPRDLIFPNRICLLAHRTNFAQSGRLNERHIAYYRRRAQGGCGLIIVGELAVHPDDRPWETKSIKAKLEISKACRTKLTI